MITKVTDLFPNVKIVATTLREVHSTNRPLERVPGSMARPTRPHDGAGRVDRVAAGTALPPGYSTV